MDRYFIVCSGTIFLLVFWADCDTLLELWKSPPKEGEFFLDVGANIGTCSMLMLSSGVNVKCPSYAVQSFLLNPFSRWLHSSRIH
jgi:hypothetical protein